MMDPLQALIAAGAIPANSFPPNSRYASTPILAHDPGDGRAIIAYLGRRLLPQTEQLAPLGEHSVSSGDRLDTISAHYLGDPELWWRIADANLAAHPDELTDTVGRRLRIAAAQGMPGVHDA
jgi:nucleoid-associated protein YgaU